MNLYISFANVSSYCKKATVSIVGKCKFFSEVNYQQKKIYFDETVKSNCKLNSRKNNWGNVWADYSIHEYTIKRQVRLAVKNGPQSHQRNPHCSHSFGEIVDWMFFFFLGLTSECNNIASLQRIPVTALGENAKWCLYFFPQILPFSGKNPVVLLYLP